MNRSDEGAQRIATHVEDWIKTGDFDQLANLLKEDRSAIACPHIFYQLFHLRRLLNWSGEEDMDDGGDASLADGQKELLPYGVKREIEGTLHNMLSAWISRMLPGYIIQRVVIPRRKGRPKRLEEGDSYGLLIEFNDLIEHLEAIGGQGAGLSPKVREGRTIFLKRIAEVVQSLHLQTFYSSEDYWVKPEPSSSRHDGPFAAWKDWYRRSVRLAPEIALSIARQSIGKKGQVHLRKLVYRLMAIHHPYLKGAESIRGHIERAEGEFPDEVKEAKRRRDKRIVI